MEISPLAGKPAEQNILVNIPRLIIAYYSEKPDASVDGQRVSFGTSGHRGSSKKEPGIPCSQGCRGKHQAIFNG
jgi:hypothetical protein